MSPYITEYYRVNDRPVVVLMTTERVKVNAWYPDPDLQRLIGKRHLISMIDAGEHQGRIDAQEYRQFCMSNQIDPEIPARSVSMSFMLADAVKKTLGARSNSRQMGDSLPMTFAPQ